MTKVLLMTYFYFREEAVETVQQLLLEIKEKHWNKITLNEDMGMYFASNLLLPSEYFRILKLY